MNRRHALTSLGALTLLACNKAPPTQEITILAAASLRGALPVLIKAYEAQHPGTRIIASFGASGDLQKQVEAGAPADAVIFASEKPVDALIAAGRVDPASRAVIAENRIVLMGPQRSRRLTFESLDTLKPGEMIAIGDPGAVPAGQYARDYLRAIGRWDALQGKLVFGGDVGAVLAYARRHEVAAAIVYRTEIRGVNGVDVYDEAKGPSAPKPKVVSGAVQGAKSARGAAEFLAFARGPEGQKTLGEFGFSPP